MRLVFFDFNINYGGGPQGSVYLAQRLNKDNEVHIIDVYGACEPYCNAIKKAGIPLHVLYPGAKKVCIGSNDKPIIRFIDAVKQIPDFLKIQKRLIEKILEIDPDVIWTGNEKSLVFLTSNLKLKTYPIALYYRGWFTQDQVKSLFCWLLKNKVSAIIAHAKATIEQFKMQGIHESRLYYTSNTIDMEKTIKDCQKDLDVTLPMAEKTPKILLSAARLEFQKGHLTAVRALALLKKGGCDPVLWLPGKISTGVNNSFKLRLQALIKELGVEENVHFIGWCENMPALIKASDIVILPSHTEGFPRIVLESMLLKRPVCATPVGGIPEAIEDGKTGFLFPIEDSQALANCMKKLHLEPPTREMIVKNAYDLVTREFGSKIHTKVVTEVFKSVVNNNKK
jgi:glycosyltransferase involved in cell wall biosynthesis